MKPIKDTKLGQWLKDKAPKVLEKVGDLLPDSGVLGVIKNLLEGEPDITPEERKQAAEFAHELELEAIKDRQSARSRETEFLKATGHMDYFMYTFGGIVLILFAYTLWVSANQTIDESMKEIFIEGRAAARDLVLSIGAYYWGSSAGSRIKDMKR